MSTNKPISPFVSRALSSNGDSSSEGDDVFVNSILDVMSRNYDLMDQQSDFEPSNSTCLLDFKMEQGSIPSVFTPSPKAMENAVIFSVNFCGKYFGEVGLFEPDISVLDWVGFKSYIFSSLNLETFDPYNIYYSDEDGDKVPIESEEDYHEALKIAKLKASEEEKLGLHISRHGGGFPSSLRSLVSSSLRRVNSAGAAKPTAPGSQPPQKKDVTTSTSFHSLDKANSNHSAELNSDDIPFVPIPQHPADLNSPQENYFATSSRLYDKNYYEFVSHPPRPETIPRAYPAYAVYPPANSNWDTVMENSQDEKDVSINVPTWFSAYMKQFKEDLSLEVSSKIDERFDEAVGNISATDVEAKLKGLLTGYSSELQNKVLCCCKPQNGGCHKVPLQASQSTPCPENPSGRGWETPQKTERDQMTPLSVLGLDPREDSIDGDAANNQDYFLQKLLKREQEILDFLDCTNEKIKQKIKVNSDYTNSLRSCLTKELAIEERERVLARIEDFRQRQSRTTNDIKLLQQSMEVNNESMLRLNLQDNPQPKDFDAKFIKDESFVDGSKVLPDQYFKKHWAVQNIGIKTWDVETFIVCQSYHQMKPFKERILCPPLKPGEVGRISAEFRAPIAPGIYSTEWRFSHCNKLFGNHLWCTVIVPPETSFGPGNKSPHHEPHQAEEFDNLQGYENYIDFEGNQNELLEDSLLNANDDNWKFNQDTEESFAQITKFFIRKMTSEQLLRYFLFIMRVAQPDFGPLRGDRQFKVFYNCLTRGDKRDYLNLRLMLDTAFLKSCSKNNYSLDEMIRSYEEIYLTDKEAANDELYIKDLSFRYLHKTFDSTEINLGFDPGNESLYNEDTERRSTAGDMRKETPLGLKVANDRVEQPVSPYNDAEILRTLRPFIYTSASELNSVSSYTNDAAVGNVSPFTVAAVGTVSPQTVVSTASTVPHYTLATSVGTASPYTVADTKSLNAVAASVGTVSPYTATSTAAPCADGVGLSAVASYNEATAVSEALQALIDATNVVTEDEDDLSSVEDGEENYDRVNRHLGGSESSDHEEGQVDDGYEAENDLHYEEDENEDEEEEEEYLNEDEAPMVLESVSPKFMMDTVCNNLDDDGEEEGEEDEGEEEEEEEEEDEDDDVDVDVDVENEEEEQDKCQNIYHAESFLETEEDKLMSGKEEDSEVDRDEEAENDDDNRASSSCSCSNCTDSESSLDSEDEEQRIGHDSDTDKVSVKTEENDLEKKSEEEEEEEDDDDIGVLASEDPDDGPQPSCSRKKAETALPARSSSTDLKKDINSLHENFNQNVQVHLDFEVLSRKPPPEERVRERSPPGLSDPLTFQERHFTISSRPPPAPVQVPESDDESFDGLVFIKDEDILSSSCPAGDHDLSSNLRAGNEGRMDDSELSMSCSSFSEYDEDDDDDGSELQQQQQKEQQQQQPACIQNIDSSSEGSLTDFFFSNWRKF